MFNKINFILLIVGFLALTVTAFNEQDLYKRFPDLDLSNAVARSRSLIPLNPLSTTDQCFEDYMQVLNDASAKYEENYKGCLDATQAERATAEEATLEERNKLAIKSENSCILLTKCKEVQTAVGVFECYASGGSENTLTMKTISSDASAQLADLREHYRIIANTESKCTKATKRTFDQELEDAYDDLNECIQASLPGSENAKTMFDIKNVASDELAGLLEKFRNIEYRETKCINEKRRVYDNELAKAYDDLNDCLLGKTTSTEKSSSTPTETPATDATSTKAPEKDDDSSAVLPYSSIIVMIFMFIITLVNLY